MLGEPGRRAGGQCDIILQWSGNTGTMGDGPASCLTQCLLHNVLKERWPGQDRSSVWFWARLDSCGDRQRQLSVIQGHI